VLSICHQQLERLGVRERPLWLRERTPFQTGDSIHPALLSSTSPRCATCTHIIDSIRFSTALAGRYLQRAYSNRRAWSEAAETQEKPALRAVRACSVRLCGHAGDVLL